MEFTYQRLQWLISRKLQQLDMVSEKYININEATNSVFEIYEIDISL